MLTVPLKRPLGWERHLLRDHWSETQCCTLWAARLASHLCHHCIWAEFQSILSRCKGFLWVVQFPPSRKSNSYQCEVQLTLTGHKLPNQYYILIVSVTLFIIIESFTHNCGTYPGGNLIKILNKILTKILSYFLIKILTRFLQDSYKILQDLIRS